MGEVFQQTLMMLPVHGIAAALRWPGGSLDAHLSSESYPVGKLTCDLYMVVMASSISLGSVVIFLCIGHVFSMLP